MWFNSSDCDYWKEVMKLNLEMTNEKLRKRLLTNIERLEYIANNTVIKISENNSIIVNSAEQNFNTFLKTNLQNKIEDINRQRKVTSCK